MAYSATQFADCQTIIKTFERAAAYCPTEESVYAMLTVPLQNMRTSAGAFVEQSELDLNTSSPTSAKTKAQGPLEQNTNIGTNFDKATEDDDSIIQNLKGLDAVQAVQDAFSIGDIAVPGLNQKIDEIEAANWYKDCINCDIRLASLEEMKQQVFINGFGNPFLEALQAMYQQMLAQIESMKELFNGDPYADLCIFIKWLKEFVCIPDLARIIAVLMALLSKMAFDFGGVVGILLSLVAPLIQPFLTNLVNTLQDYIFLILKPIECIINKFQTLLASADVLKAMEDGLASVNIPITWRRNGEVTGQANLGVMNVNLHETGSATTNPTQLIQDTFGVNISIQERINAKKAENQQKVEEAARKLEALDKSAQNINMSNPQEIERFNKRRQEAKEEYDNAIESRDLSAIQRVNKRITEGMQIARSAILQLMQYLREAVQSVEAYINQLWDELKKLTLEFGGGHSSFLGDLLKKMQIVQIIQLVYSLIKNAGLEGCDNEEDASISAAENSVAIALNNLDSNVSFWVDEDGNMHLEDTNDGLTDAIDAVVEVFGFDPNSPVTPGTQPADKSTSPSDIDNINSAAAAAANSGDRGQQTQNQIPLSTLANTQNLSQTDRGNSVTEARQKLNSLIQLTGDPVLDSQIARATEAAVSRTNITFKCPLQTSVTNAEQVNKWISELTK